MEEVALPLERDRTDGRTAAEAQIARFAAPYRTGLRGLIRLVPRAEDLLVSFPALAFALTTSYAQSPAQHRSLAIVAAGGNLKAAAEELGLAWWMRKLPPEAFVQPLRRYPDGAEFARRIANHIPAETWRCAAWFTRVELALDLVDEEFALWVAWRTKNVPRMRDVNMVVLLSAWAWFSRHPGTAGGKLVRAPFNSLVGFSKAMEETDNWRKRVDLAVVLGRGINDPWYQGGNFNGYDFEPLKTVDDFVGQSAIMHNCLDQYGRRVALRTTRVFSIRRDNIPVACLEIGPHDDDTAMPKIEQLRGPYNQRVSPLIWQATYAWLGSQKPRPISAVEISPAASLDVSRRVWGPFVAAVGATRSADVVRRFLKCGDVLDPEL